MTPREETKKHIDTVRGYLGRVVANLLHRGDKHDHDKLESPWAEVYEAETPKLAKLEYGSEAYKESLKALGPALDHHYTIHDHHPEHFWLWTCDCGGWVTRPQPHALPVPCSCGAKMRRTNVPNFGSMSLLALTEMLVDWKAASERHETGDIHRSIDLNQVRFGYGDEIKAILHTTADQLWPECRR